MKLLLDENLSDRIVNRIIDLYPDSEHVKPLALTNTDDSIIWEYAALMDGVASILGIGDRWKILQKWIQTVLSLPFLEKCLT